MKKDLLFVVCLVTFCNVQAQNSSYANRMQHIFGNIDKNKVTTGYLKEFGVRFANIEACNGNLSADNFVTKSEWQAIYSSLYSMRVGQGAINMTSPQTINNQFDTQQNNTEDVLIAVQHYNYQQYKTNAYTNGDIKISNDRIFDRSGRNPYDTKTLFAITPLKQQLQGNTFTFQLPSNLLYSNFNTSISQIQIDYDNGQGYQTISQNQKKSVSYCTGGEKEIKVKITYTNGTIVQSHSKIWVDYVAANHNTQARFNGFGTDILWSNNPITGNVYNGSSATGKVTIELAPGHTQLTKPLIVIEGFDPENSFNYFDLIFDFDPNGNSVGTLDIVIDGNTGLTLNEAIEDEDYDLVFVDFVNSTDFIQRNAYMVEEVIRQINQLKAASGSTEKNVVLGMSMGGLVGRYALRHMEIEGETHDTKLYISHDTPHQGANVPLAAQALVRHLVGEEISLPVFFSLFNVNILDLEDNVDGLSEALALLQSPAAQQMLIYQLQGTGNGVSINNNTLYSSFLNEYKNMGYPQQNGIRNIAIANGAECGNPLDFNPYSPIVNANIEVDLPFFLTNIALAIVNGFSIKTLKFLSSLLSTNTDIKAQFTLRALPSLQSRQIYRGRIYIKKTILFFITVHEPLIDEEAVNSSSNMLALDNANGGIYDIENFAKLPVEFEQYVLQKRFNFIPAYSSLDVGSGNVTINPSDLAKVYNPLSPPPVPKDIPFDNFFTNPTTSEAHIQFTLNNGDWLISELTGTPEILSCAFACSNEVTISGNDFLCTGSTSSYILLGGAENYSWQIISGGNLASINNSNNNVVSLTTTSNSNLSGKVVLRGSINSTRCNFTETLQKEIYVGKPKAYTRNPDPTICANVFLQDPFYTLPVSPGTTSYSLTSNSPYLFVDSVVYPETEIFMTATRAGNYTVTLTTTNSCGSKQATIYVTVDNCNDFGGGFFLAYPNPTSNTLTIENTELISTMSAQKSSRNSSNLSSKSSVEVKSNHTFKIYDFNGSEVLSGKLNSKTNIDVSKLKKGKYILVINTNGNNETHQIIIE